MNVVWKVIFRKLLSTKREGTMHTDESIVSVSFSGAWG